MGLKRSGQPLHLPDLAATAALVLTVGLTNAACGSSDEDYYAHCVDSRTGQVIDPDYCDNDFDGRGGYYYYMAPTQYQYGYVVPPSARTGSGWFRSNDTTARASAGLPATGKVGKSFTVRSSRGGFSGKSSGSSGGGSGGKSGGS